MGFISTISDRFQDFFVQEVVDAESLIAAHTPAQLSAFLPYYGHDPDNGLFILDNSIGFAVEIVPLTGGDASTVSALTSLLGLLVPDMATVQVMMHSSARLAPLFRPWVASRTRATEARGWEPSHVYNRITQGRVAHLLSGVWGSAARGERFHLRDHRVVFSCSIPLSDDATDATTNELIERLIEYRDSVLSTFDQVSAGFLMSPKSLVQLVGEILNPSLSPDFFPGSYDPSLSLAQQVVWPDTTYKVYRDRIETTSSRIGDPDVSGLLSPSGDTPSVMDDEMEIVTFEVVRFPQQVSFGTAIRLIGDSAKRDVSHSGPATSVLTIHYPKKEEALASAQNKAMRAKQVAGHGLSKYNPDAFIKSREWEAVSQQFSSGAHRPVRISMFSSVVSPKGRRRQVESNTRSVFDTAGYSVRRCDQVHLPTLITMLPMVGATPIGSESRTLGRMRFQSSATNAALSPLLGEYLGRSVDGPMLVGQLGQPFGFSVFETVGQANMNSTVIGPSGTGKSVLLNEKAFCHCATGGRVFVIDDGESFKNHCGVVGGRHYMFDLASEFVLNVFDMIIPRGEWIAIEAAEKGLSPSQIDPKGYLDYLNGIRQVAVDVFVQMCFGDEACSRAQRGVINEAVNHVIDNAVPGRLSGSDEVYAYLKDLVDTGRAVPDLKVDSMLASMSPYCGRGQYASHFNGANTLRLDSHMTVFEMKPLEQLVELRAVIVTTLFAFIDGAVTRDRGSRDLVILDEAWKHMENDHLCNTIAGWARRLRKYNAAIMIATQNYSDFGRTEITKSIIQNCHWKLLLPQPSQAIQQMSDDNILNSPYRVQMARRLRMSPGSFSELLILGEGSTSVGRLVLDPLALAMYSTDAGIVRRINQLKAQGLGTHDALKAVVEENAS